ncbi:MAG: hypothetical protein GXP14_15640 [Gammaproteobacteria bacterium]|nr:hypothetical protein [Gammaproteobacteria bacterium]
MRSINKIVLLVFIAVTFLATGSAQAHSAWNQPFVHGIAIKVGHHKYYLEGAPDGPNGEQDIPGHEWVQVSKNTIIGKHYNTGPFGAANFWSFDAPDGALLWTMIGKIDTWTEAKAAKYYTEGYIHYHSLVSAKTGKRHPKKVVWLRHSAVIDFTFDALPNAVEPYEVKIGSDYKMAPNWTVPYDPNIGG